MIICAIHIILNLGISNPITKTKLNAMEDMNALNAKIYGQVIQHGFFIN